MSNIFPKATKHQSWWLIENILLRVSGLSPLMNIQCNSHLCFAIHRRSRLNQSRARKKEKTKKKKEKGKKFSQKNPPSSLEPRRDNIANPLLPTSNPKERVSLAFRLLSQRRHSMSRQVSKIKTHSSRRKWKHGGVFARNRARKGWCARGRGRFAWH